MIVKNKRPAKRSLRVFTVANAVDVHTLVYRKFKLLVFAP